MGRTARASVMAGREFEIREYPVPEPEPEQRYWSSRRLGGICGTDLHNWQFQRLGYDVILGHENVGTLDALGDGVGEDAAGNPVQVGDRVVVSPHLGVGFQPIDRAPGLRGGFGQYIYLWNPTNVFLKTDLPPEIAVLTEPSACSYHCVSRAGIQLGDTVVIQGTGPIGLLAIAWARRAGAGRLIAVGGPAGRLEFAERLGADLVIDIERRCRTPRNGYGSCATTRRGAPAPTWCASAPVSWPRFRRGSTTCGVAAPTSSSATSWTPAPSSATPTRC